MSAAIEIPKAQWRAYFDRISSELDRGQLSIEVSGDGWPPQLEASGLELQFTAYDARDDLFEVAAEVAATAIPQVFHHLVAQPERVRADRPSPTQTTIEVDGSDGTRTVLRIER